MVDIAGGLRVDNRLRRILAILYADSGEQVRHLEVLFLGPLLQRMIVAAGAGEALPEKRLRDVFG